MRYITLDELQILKEAAERIKDNTFTAEYKKKVEFLLEDTVDEIDCGGIKTLKYSNVLLIGLE